MRHWRAWAAVPLLLAIVVASNTASASTDPLQNRKSSVDGQIDQLRETLEGASKDVVAAAGAVRTAQLQLAAAQAASRDAQAALAAGGGGPGRPGGARGRGRARPGRRRQARRRRGGAGQGPAAGRRGAGRPGREHNPLKPPSRNTLISLFLFEKTQQ